MCRRVRAIRPPGIALPNKLEVEMFAAGVEVGGMGRAIEGETEPAEEKAGRRAFCPSGVETGRVTGLAGGLGSAKECEEEGVEGDSRVLNETRLAWLLFGTETVRAGGGRGRRAETGERFVSREERARRKESTVSF